jgi:hypothetical protein
MCVRREREKEREREREGERERERERERWERAYVGDLVHASYPAISSI